MSTNPGDDPAPPSELLLNDKVSAWADKSGRAFEPRIVADVADRSWFVDRASAVSAARCVGGGQQMRAACSRRSRPRQDVEEDQWLSKVSVNTSVAPPVSSPKTTSLRGTS